MRKFAYIQSVVIFLFAGAWLLQSLSPLMMYQMSQHDSKAMICRMNGHCGGSCCCNCTSAGEEDDTIKICGCDHHGNPLGMASPFEIKAPLHATFDGPSFSAEIISMHLNLSPFFIFTDDIFHPPRLNT
ncbi:MAG: hypothetical protein PVH63_05300 [Balneolaceae bacterium]|jgi:hypothetical protein